MKALNPSLSSAGAPSSPWFFFFIFLTALALISYFPLAPAAQAGIGFFGLLLPFVLALRYLPPSETAVLLRKEFLPALPPWVWVLAGAMALAARFYGLTSLSGWPLTDEGWHGFFGLHLLKHWDGSLFYSIGRVPAGYFWALAACFRLFGVSLESLWLLPAALSFGAFLWLALAVRKVSGRSFSFLFFCLAGLGFGPLYCGRISHQGVLAFFWESFCLWLAVHWPNSSGPRQRVAMAGAMGLALGAGFYTFTSWWTVFFLLTAFTLVRMTGVKGAFPGAAAFGLGLLLPALPFWINLAQGAGTYFSDLFLFKNAASLAYGWKFALSNVTMWFWGTDPEGACYGPVWGGILNPLGASAFGLGLIHLLREWRNPWNRWLLAALGLGLLPGILSVSVEIYRTLPVLPFLLLVCGLGWSRLFSFQRPARSCLLALLCGAASFGLDAYHLLGPYHRLWGIAGAQCPDSKSVERWRAFQYLAPQAESQGPGILFTDFVLKSFDQTLTLAGYSFDALRNPALSVEKARWFAVLANPHFVPFLQKRFPEGRWFWLSGGLSRPDGGMSLGIIPLESKDRSALPKWLSANAAFRKMTLEMLFQQSKKGGREILDEWEGLQPLVKGDPFLESCLWEKMEFYDILIGDLPAALRSLQKGMSLGCPNAFFEDQMGLVLWRENRPREARFWLEKALKNKLNLTPARQNLTELEQIFPSLRKRPS